MTAPKRLRVGSVRECDLDLDEHVARTGLRSRHVLEAYVPGGVEAEGSHGSKTIFSASPLR